MASQQMIQEVYVDVVFGLNFGTDMLWLLATAALAGVPVRWGRLALAAGAGGAAAAWAFFPSGMWLTGLPGRLAGTLALLALAFWPLPLRQMARTVGYLLLSGVAMAGTALAAGLWTLGPSAGASASTAVPAGPAVPDGVAVPGGLVAAGLLACVVGGRFLWEAARQRSGLRRGLWRLRVRLGDAWVELPALLDTGNDLRAPLTGTPVAVAEAGALAGLLPPAVIAAAVAGWGALEGLPAEWAARCRPVPFQSVGREEGVLLAFAPDEVAVCVPGAASGWQTVRALVGLAGFPLHPDGAYRALLPGRLAGTADAMSASAWEGETR